MYDLNTFITELKKALDSNSERQKYLEQKSLSHTQAEQKNRNKATKLAKQFLAYEDKTPSSATNIMTLAAKEYINLISQPERYLIIAMTVELGEVTQDEATAVNIKKAYELAHTAIARKSH
jgi:type III secretory pathway component EscV